MSPSKILLNFKQLQSGEDKVKSKIYGTIEKYIDKLIARDKNYQ